MVDFSNWKKEGGIEGQPEQDSTAKKPLREPNRTTVGDVMEASGCLLSAMGPIKIGIVTSILSVSGAFALGSSLNGWQLGLLLAVIAAVPGFLVGLVVAIILPFVG